MDSMMLMPFNPWILNSTLPLLNSEVANQRKDMLHKKMSYYFKWDTLQCPLTLNIQISSLTCLRIPKDSLQEFWACIYSIHYWLLINYPKHYSVIIEILNSLLYRKYLNHSTQTLFPICTDYSFHLTMDLFRNCYQ